jgi:protein TonB
MMRASKEGAIMTAKTLFTDRRQTTRMLQASVLTAGLPAALMVLILAGCSSPMPSMGGGSERVDTTSDGTSTENTINGYKRDLAQRITEVNSTKIYPGRPQALLRSVVVVRYAVDSRGNLMRSEILRSNNDAATEATALATLRNTAPFPKPASHLLRQGRVEISETWLFNNDGRFQLRSVAQPQMSE